MAAAARPSVRRRRRVLVVEDDADAAQVTMGMLELLGFDATIARDGNDALVQLTRASFDLVLLDVCLPRMNGVLLMQVARSQPALAGLPVIAMTGVYSTDGAEAGALRASGVARVLPKPFSSAQLRSAVGAALGVPRAAEPARAPVAPERVPKSAAPKPAVPLRPPAVRTRPAAKQTSPGARTAPGLRTSSSGTYDDPRVVRGRLHWSRQSVEVRLLQWIGDDPVVRCDGPSPPAGASARLTISHRRIVSDRTRTLDIRGLAMVERVRGAVVRLQVQAAPPGEQWALLKTLELL